MTTDLIDRLRVIRDKRTTTPADGRVINEAMTALTATPSAQAGEVEELDRYDAGLLGDFGGGNVEWWQNYLRSELERAHEFYQSQITSPRTDEPARPVGYDDGSGRIRDWREPAPTVDGGVRS